LILTDQKISSFVFFETYSYEDGIIESIAWILNFLYLDYVTFVLVLINYVLYQVINWII
jgi:hypothetical protein